MTYQHTPLDLGLVLPFLPEQVWTWNTEPQEIKLQKLQENYTEEFTKILGSEQVWRQDQSAAQAANPLAPRLCPSHKQGPAPANPPCCSSTSRQNSSSSSKNHPQRDLTANFQPSPDPGCTDPCPCQAARPGAGQGSKNARELLSPSCCISCY